MFGPVMGTLPPEGDLQSMYELSHTHTIEALEQLTKNDHDHTHTHTIVNEHIFLILLALIWFHLSMVLLFSPIKRRTPTNASKRESRPLRLDRYLRIGRRRENSNVHFLIWLLFRLFAYPFPFLTYSMSMCKHNDQSAYIQTNERTTEQEAFSSTDELGHFQYCLARSFIECQYWISREREKEKEMKVFIGEQCWMSRALRSSSRCNQHEKVGVPKMLLVRLTSIVQRNYRWIWLSESERAKGKEINLTLSSEEKWRRRRIVVDVVKRSLHTIVKW
jgi:hypothetical protein